MDEQEASRRFYAWIWPLREALLRWALVLVREHALADDLAQETLIKAFRGMAGFKEGSDPKAWLMQILRHTRIDYLRAHRKVLSLETMALDLPDDPQESPRPWSHPQEILEALSDEDLIEALQMLPEEIRWTLLLVEVEGLSLQEAADVLAIPVGTAKSRIFRGREMMRQKLSPSGGPEVTRGRK